MVASVRSLLFVRRWFLLLVFLLAMVVRSGNLLCMPANPAVLETRDSIGYIQGAESWSESGSFSGWLRGEDVLPTFRAPGYMWFLSALDFLGIKGNLGVALVQALISSATCVLVALLGFCVSASIGRLSGILAALSPTLVIESTLVLQDTMMLLPLLGSVVLAVHAVRAGRWSLGLGVGVLLGITLMIRAVVQFLIVFLVVSAVLLLVSGFLMRRLRRYQGVAAAFLVGILVSLAPLSYRAVQLGSAYPTTQSGLHALFWTVTLIHTNETGKPFSEQKEETIRMVEREYVRRGIDPGSLSSWQLDAVHRSIALAELKKTSPVLVARVWLQGAVVSLFSPALLVDGRVRSLERPSYYETPGANLVEKGYRYFFSDFGLFQAVILTGMVGAAACAICILLGTVSLVRRRPLLTGAGILFTVYFLVISGPTSGPKYRMPYQPMLIVAMAAGLESIARRRSGRLGFFAPRNPG